MRIFLTGSTGVIGRRVIPQLVEAGHEVTAGGRQSTRLQALQLTGASVLPLDLFDSAAVKQALAGQDAVINLATHVPPGLRAFLPGAWRENDRIRTAGSALLVNGALANDVQIFIQESFVTYPDSADRWIAEDTPPDPPAYNRTVIDAENAAARFARSGRRGLALRFAFFYGTGDPFTETTLKSVRRGWLPISGRPEGFFSMVNHDDAASAVVAALKAPSGNYNVVDDEPLTRRALADVLAEILGVEPPKLPPAWAIPLTGSVGDMVSRSLRVSNAKLREATGWAPHYPSAREGWRAALESGPTLQPYVVSKM
ncbi:MAG TPA: NAD(P)-dependent oxidoreductase [Gemmatimonadales bacterium]|jgi:nucleoside-diphosphate-sugar epimerase